MTLAAKGAQAVQLALMKPLVLLVLALAALLQVATAQELVRLAVALAVRVQLAARLERALILGLALVARRRQAQVPQLKPPLGL